MKKSVFYTFLLMLAVMFGAPANVMAIPVNNVVITHRQSDGTVITVRLVGDEHCHAYYSADGEMLRVDSITGDFVPVGKVDFNTYYKQHVNRIAAMHRMSGLDANGRTSFPTRGDLKGIVLLVEFSDNSFQPEYNQQLFNDFANGDNYNYDGATGSIKKFFSDQSYGNFRLNFDVVGPVKLNKPINFYGADGGDYNQDANASIMIKEACEQADTLYNVDFSKYDNDHDGYVDFVYVIYAGYAQSYGAPSYTIWPHQAYINERNVYLTLDSVQVNRYACSSELMNATGTTLTGIGPFCHEFGHVLGLPDLYQTNGGSGVALGQWDIMDRGCYNNDTKTPAAYSAFERYCMRWLNYTPLNAPATGIQLPCLADSARAYVLTSNNSNEYFVLENREQRGWDAPQAASGLMITHVNYSDTKWSLNSVNNDETNFGVSIMPADGTRGVAYEGDLFPNGGKATAFTDNTTPSSVLSDGTPLGKSVSGIALDDGIVTFSFMQKKLLQPQLLQPLTTASSITFSWQPVDGAQSYRLVVKDVLPDSVRQVMAADDFSGLKAGSYSLAHSTDIADSLDSYMQQTGWTGSNIYQAGGMAQLGKYGVNGTLTTPVLALAQNDSALTLKFTARAYTSRSVNYYVTVTDTAGTQVYRERFKATSTPDTFYKVITVGQGNYKVSLQTNHERLFLSNFSVVRGLVDSASVDSVADPSWTIDNLTDTVYTLDALTAGHTYSYYLQALSGDVLYDSDPTATFMVTLPEQTNAIGKLNVNDTSATVAVYTAQGVCVYCGSMRSFMNSSLKGLFIIKRGNSVTKIVKR